MATMRRMAALVAMTFGVTILGLLAFSSGSMASEFSGIILPDITLQTVVDYITNLLQNPNIYASFDYHTFLDFARNSYLGGYFLIGLIGIYFFSLFFMMFGLRKARKAVR
jgi:hypothetical protein